MQIINPFTFSVKKYIVAVKVLTTKKLFVSYSCDTIEEAEKSLNTHKSYFRNCVSVKIFEAIGNTCKMYIDAKAVIK
ncbi:MAG: hypothetical protein LBC64_01795 [Fibromonadaceae bacterium]|jgi:hypothetical protein|nr:hypothetical protein [Fibromonadaceae bacterium]